MITFTSIIQQGDGTWTFTWASTGASFYRAILKGKELNGNITTTSYNYPLTNYTTYAPPLEVVSETDLADSEQFSPLMVMQWYCALGVDHYELDQMVSDTWVNRLNFTEVGKAPVYTYITTTLKDDLTYSYRVMSVDGIGQLSTPIVFDNLIVTPPILVETSIRTTYGGASDQNIHVTSV